MNAAARLDVGRLRSAGSAATARLLVAVVLVAVGVLAAALLTAALLPTGSLTARLLGTSGAARGGAYTQDLVAHLGERLRLAAGLLLGLLVGLVWLRRPLENIVRLSLGDLTSPLVWPSRSTWLGVGTPMLLAIGLRFAFVGQPMRYDEALTFNEFASRPLYYGLSFYPDPNNHLLNTLLVHLAVVGMGNQPWVLRLPALLAGVLLVPATYALARLLYDRRAAFLSAALVGVSSYLVEYSTNSRGYTLQALCFVATLSLAIVALRRDSPSALLLAAFVAALGAYAVPTMLYGVLIVAAWIGLEYRRVHAARIRRSGLAACGLVLGLAVAVLYLPVLLVSGADKLAANRFVVPLDAGELASELPHSLARTFAFWNRDVPGPIVALLVVGFFAATAAEAWRRRLPLGPLGPLAPLGLLAPLVCLAMVMLQRVAPFERVWLFLLPVYLAIAAGGLSYLAAGRLNGAAFTLAGYLLAGLLAVFTLTSGSILASDETGAFPDAAAVATTLSGRLSPGDAVVTLLPASLPELQYSFPRAGLPIDALVRSPADAVHLYVVAPLTATPSIAGWGQPAEMQRYPGSALFVLQRT